MLPSKASTKSLFPHTDQVSKQWVIRDDIGEQGMQCLVRKYEGRIHFADLGVGEWLI
jgi:hypothetical protein